MSVHKIRPNQSGLKFAQKAKNRSSGQRGPITKARVSHRKKKTETCFTMPFGAAQEARLDDWIAVAYDEVHHGMRFMNPPAGYAGDLYRLRHQSKRAKANRNDYRFVVIPETSIGFYTPDTEPRCKSIDIYPGEIIIGLTKDMTVEVKS